MPALWIKNARVIDPASKRDSVGDLFASAGRIAASLSAAEKKAAKVIDARGLVAAPGTPGGLPRGGNGPRCGL